jgi:hypothetical protein
MTRVILAIAALSITLAIGLPTASAHRNPCHTKHTCPSDHHTYRWHGSWCTSYKSERLVTDRKVVKVAGRTYWCGAKKTGKRL